MNKFINVLLLFILFPTMLFTIWVGFDLPVEFFRTSGGQVQYRFEIFLTLGLFILILNLRRSVRRWMGMRMVNKVQKFKWNEPMSKNRIQRVQVYTLLEAMVLFFVGTVLYYLTTEAWMPAVAFWFGAVDNIVFLIVGSMNKRFRAGVTSKAIIVADRDVSLVYFSGLRKISIQQDTIYFDYIKELQLFFPLACIPEDEREKFFEVIEAQVDTNRVFVTKNR